MAAARHNLTRRALLGAGAGACFAAAARGAAYALDDPLSPFGLSPSKASPPLVPEERSALRQAQGERALDQATVRARWDRALAAYRRAEARVAAFRRYEASLAPAARAFPACEPLEERFDDLECARLAALRRLLRLRAPDLAALSLKIDLTVDNQAWELTDSDACLATLRADARRLCNGG